jgi:xanthosine utilization system XapX-like protein
VCSFGIAATLLAFACLLVYASTSATELYGVVSTRLAAPYAVLALFGVLTMLGGWVVQLRHATSHWPSLVATTLGMLLVIVGVTVVREVQRLRAVDMSAFTAAHEQALKSGGLWAFLVFLTVNSLLVVFALRVAHEAIARGTE